VKKQVRLSVPFLALFLIALWFAIPVQGFGDDAVLRVGDGKTIGFAQMIDEIKDADLVFVGEEHNNLKHHHAQLDVIKALHKQKKHLAIGVEMFRAGSQKELDLWVAGQLTTGAFIRIYNDNWGRIPWPWYKNIFIYAKTFDLPMIGLNIPDVITTKIAKSGCASLTDDEKKQLPAGIRCDIDEHDTEHLRKAHAAYSDHSASFEHFSEAQVVWDASMALYLIDFKKKNPGTTVVVLAGNEHAGKRGVSQQILRLSKLRSTVILPESAGRTDRGSITREDADYLLLDEGGNGRPQ
jgi:uncharacterized iron-regulated protein